jgi:hypothetical protein
MHYGELPRHDHDLAKHCCSHRARGFVERDACDARSSCCSVGPSAVAMYLFVQHFVKKANY